jgi:hypothetical protein
MPEVRRSTTRASGRGEQSDALLEMRTVSDRLARDHALQPHDSKDWTHPHCCFHATIHGLTELSIFNNITMLELRTTVTEWLNTAPEPETEGGIEWWAIQRQAASTHAGIFKAQRPSQIRKQWKQANAMRIDIAPHKRPRKKNPHHVPDPHYKRPFTFLHTPTSTISNPRHLDDSRVYHSIL